ncbi:hypothetical protein TUM2330_00280 [Escherichia coli]|nr:hypothetical protein TUM2330_00280 [Escherichia coli]
MVAGESRDSWISAIVSVIDSTRAGKGSKENTASIPRLSNGETEKFTIVNQALPAPYSIQI